MIKAIRIVLTVIFSWSLFQSIQLMVRGTSMDQLILIHFGLGPLFWLLLAAISLTTLGAIVYCWNPKPLLYRVAQASVWLNILETALVSGLAASNTAVAKEAFITSRTSRGLPVHPEVTSLIEQPLGHIFSFAAVLLMGVIWLVLFWLLKRDSQAAPPT